MRKQDKLELNKQIAEYFIRSWREHCFRLTAWQYSDFDESYFWKFNNPYNKNCVIRQFIRSAKDRYPHDAMMYVKKHIILEDRRKE